MPVDVRQSGGGGGDDWLGDTGELDWDADVREPGRTAPRRAATPAAAGRSGDARPAHGRTRGHDPPAPGGRRRRGAAARRRADLARGCGLRRRLRRHLGDHDDDDCRAAAHDDDDRRAAPTTTTTQTTPETTPPATTTPPPAETIPEDERLELESTGDSVEQLQVTLKELGFDPGPADGDFGPLTQAAVVAFQTANDLDPDGVVGPITAGALNAALAAQASG